MRATSFLWPRHSSGSRQQDISRYLYLAPPFGDQRVRFGRMENFRANICETPNPHGNDRSIFYGSRDQIAADLAATRDLGVSEIFVDPTFSPAGQSVEGFLSAMEQLRELL